MSTAPKLWLLTGGRLGDLKQMRALAEALQWPCEEKRLTFRYGAFPFAAPWFVAPSIRSLMLEQLPDLILCSEANCAAVAQAIRKKSGGKTKVLALGRPLGHPRHVDLVLTTAQYGLEPGPNVVAFTLPLGVSAASTAKSGDVTLLLVGGASAPDQLDAAIAVKMLRDVQQAATKAGHRLVVVTGPRTPPDATAALKNAIQAPHEFIVFGDTARPYATLLAKAAHIIVTSDSVSMVSDAVAAGKSVSIYRLPSKPGPLQRFSEILQRPEVGFLTHWLFDLGFVETIADRQRFFDGLAEKGLVTWFGDDRTTTATYHPADDIERAVAAAWALLNSMDSSDKDPRK